MCPSLDLLSGARVLHKLYREDIFSPLALCSIPYVRSLMFAVAYLRMVMQRRVVDRHRTTINVPVSDFA